MSFEALSTVYSRDSTYAMHIAMHVSSVDMLIVLIVYKMWGRKGVIFYTGIVDFAAGEGMPDIGILFFGNFVIFSAVLFLSFTASIPTPAAGSL